VKKDIQPNASLAPAAPIAPIRSKFVLAMITQSIRMDNLAPTKYFQKFAVKHFYHDAPYGDLRAEDLKNVVQWHSLKDLEKKLTQLNPDLIQGAEPYASRLALRICLSTMKVAKKLNRPYFFPILENRPTNERFGPLIGPLVRLVLKKYAQRAKLIFYLNEGAKRNLAAVGVPAAKAQKALYGVWGVDTYLFKPIIHRPLGDKKYILFVGRFIEDKGVPYILAAFKSIKNKFPNVTLVFIGSGLLSKEITGSQIINLGPMKNAALPPYFTHALFTLYPSITMKRWEEQVGMVNLQSLACGTPVLTTSSGAIAEYVTDQVGIIVEERDANALAEAMEKLLKNNELRESLAKNARSYVLANFDAQKTVQKIEKILLELI